MGKQQAREIKDFSAGWQRFPDAFRSDELLPQNAHFGPKTALFPSLSPCRSDYPPPRPIAKKMLKINGLLIRQPFSEIRLFGVAIAAGVEIVQLGVRAQSLQKRFQPNLIRDSDSLLKMLNCRIIFKRGGNEPCTYH